MSVESGLQIKFSVDTILFLFLNDYNRKMIIWLLSTFFTTTNTKLDDFVKDKVTLITHRYISGYIKIKNSIFFNSKCLLSICDL